MLNKPKPPSQPTPGSFTTALDTIFEGRVPDSMLKEHEERPKTMKEAKDSLYNCVATIRDQARNAGFIHVLKPKWMIDQEAKEKGGTPG